MPVKVTGNKQVLQAIARESERMALALKELTVATMKRDEAYQRRALALFEELTRRVREIAREPIEGV